MPNSAKELFHSQFQYDYNSVSIRTGWLKWRYNINIHISGCCWVPSGSVPQQYRADQLCTLIQAAQHSNGAELLWSQTYKMKLYKHLRYAYIHVARARVMLQ